MDKKDISASSQESLLIRSIPDEAGGFIGEFHASHLQMASPVPPADELKKLKEVLNDGPERLFAMAEKALDHKMELEKNNAKTESYLAKKSIWFAFFIAFLGIICSTVLILNGHAVVGTILSAGTLGTIIASFMSLVYDKADKKRNKSIADESESPERVKADKSLPDPPPE